MKILLLSDTHLRYRGPSSRKDDFFEVQRAKFQFVLEQYDKNGCGLFLQAGDFFDSPYPPNFLISTYLRMLLDWGGKIHCVLGQHDLPMHNISSVVRSGTGVLVSAGVLTILNSEPVTVDGVDLYGASWGEDPPVPRSSSNLKVLVIHRMVGDSPLYPGQNLERPSDIVSLRPEYDLILCGDYHYSYSQRVGKTLVVNTGALVRQTCGVRDLHHHPTCVIYDTQTHEYEVIEIPHRPSSEIFKEQFEKREDANPDLNMFIDRLRAELGGGMSFSDNLRRYCDTEGVSDDVCNVIFDTLKELESTPK